MQTKRPRYYKGKLLKSEDLIQEQQYQEDVDKQIRLLQHGSGILQGLTLQKAQDSVLKLSEGCAIGQDGASIIVKQSCEIDLRELKGFERMEGFHGYITISAVCEKTDKVYCEFSEQPLHEEFDSWQDGYEVHIQDELKHTQQYAPFFQSCQLFEHDGINVTAWLPNPLPETGNVNFYLQEENPMNVEGSLALEILSPHFVMTPVQKALGTKTRWQCYELERDPNSGGTLSDVKLRNLQVQLGEKHFALPEKTLTVNISRHIREDTLKQLTENSSLPMPPVILGEVFFAYHQDHLQIEELQEGVRTYAAHARKEYQLSQLLKGFGYRERMIAKTAPVKENERTTSGILTILFEEHKDTYFSNEISHGLGSGNVRISTVIEEVVSSAATSTPQRLYGGDTSLFLKEEVHCATCLYPQKGSFQIAFRRTTTSMQKKYFVYWYAQRYPHLKAKDAHLHLQRLKPSTITIPPNHTVQFIPIFNQSAPDAIVTYSCDENGGQMEEEGRYHAPAISGVYQVRAVYQDDVVYAYVKVKDEGHE